MTYRDLARLLVKIGGLFLLVRALAGLPSAILMFVRAYQNEGSAFLGVIDADSLAVSTVAPLAVQLIAGLGMLLFTGRIVDGPIVTPASAEPMDLTAFEAVAVSVLGLYFIGTALVEGAGCVVDFLRGYGDIASTVAFSANLLVGLVLIARRRSLAERLVQLRDAVQALRTARPTFSADERR